MAESDEALPLRDVLSAEADDFVAFSSGRFSKETKTVDFDGLSVEVRRA